MFPTVPTRSGECCGLDPGQETVGEGRGPRAADSTQHAARWSLTEVSAECILKNEESKYQTIHFIFVHLPTLRVKT